MWQMLSLFVYPIAVGALMAMACSLFGVFVLTKRVVFIGVALSQVSACGVAIALALHFSPFLGALGLTIPVAIVLAFPFESTRIPREAVLGIVFVAASAFAILAVSKNASELQQVKVILYGNLLFASSKELYVVLGLLAPVFLYFFGFLRPTLYTFLDRDAAQVAGIRVILWEQLFFIAMALVVAASTKIVGALLTFCYLVSGPAIGLLFGNRLWQTFVVSCLFNISLTLLGMFISFRTDLPTSYTISALCASCVVVLGLVRWGYALGATAGSRLRG